MIRFFDMFAGIGGFRSGLEAVGGFKCIGHCEIDKYAQKAYNAIFRPKGEYFCNDARTINPSEMPDFDLICAGFPCQSFSVAGKRLGFEDTVTALWISIRLFLCPIQCSGAISAPMKELCMVTTIGTTGR